MEVLTAKTAGFCFGVERAVREAQEAAKEADGIVYTFGPIVHNETVIRDLEKQGIVSIPDEAALKDVPKGSTILIRAHGISRALENRLKDEGYRLIDATCPFVKKIHRLAEKYDREGLQVVVAGDAAHPEVIGICGYAESAAVVSSTEELCEIAKKKNGKICLLAQTTFNHKKFKNMVENLEDLGYNATIADTVCSATRERQEEAADLASRADVMIVIGGKDSSNSQKLYEICKRNCNRTYFIQTAADLMTNWWCGVNIVGITAGASTPKTIIKEVQTNVRKF